MKFSFDYAITNSRISIALGMIASNFCISQAKVGQRSARSGNVMLVRGLARVEDLLLRNGEQDHLLSSGTF